MSKRSVLVIEGCAAINVVWPGGGRGDEIRTQFYAEVQILVVTLEQCWTKTKYINVTNIK
jgi:hypothetical protein